MSTVSVRAPAGSAKWAEQKQHAHKIAAAKLSLEIKYNFAQVCCSLSEDGKTVQCAKGAECCAKRPPPRGSSQSGKVAYFRSLDEVGKLSNWNRQDGGLVPTDRAHRRYHSQFLTFLF